MRGNRKGRGWMGGACCVLALGLRRIGSTAKA